MFWIGLENDDATIHFRYRLGSKSQFSHSKYRDSPVSVVSISQFPCSQWVKRPQEWKYKYHKFPPLTQSFSQATTHRTKYFVFPDLVRFWKISISNFVKQSCLKQRKSLKVLWSKQKITIFSPNNFILFYRFIFVHHSFWTEFVSGGKVIWT